MCPPDVSPPNVEYTLSASPTATPGSATSWCGMLNYTTGPGFWKVVYHLSVYMGIYG